MYLEASIPLKKMSYLTLLWITFFLVPSFAGAQGTILVPKPQSDLSAHRIDSDIFGWNDDYSEMAAIGLDVKRGPKGKHRGEVFMLIFPIDSITPIQNVKLHHVTQADMPHNPLPILDVRKYLWTLGYGLPKMWPKHARKKKPKHAMNVTPIWLPQKQKSGLCRPAVGFLLSKQNTNRYQPHQVLNIEAPCQYLRLTDKRTYFAHKLLAGSMLRFDYSGTDNEASIRFPMSVQWHGALPLNIEIQMPKNMKTHELKTLRKQLKGIQHFKTSTHKEVLLATQIIYTRGFSELAKQIALKLDAEPTLSNAKNVSSIVIKIAGQSQP